MNYHAKEFDSDFGDYKLSLINLERVEEINVLNEAFRETNSILDNCRHLVGSFNHNNALKRELNVQQAQLNYATRIKLKAEVPARYAFIYSMVNSICINQQALERMALDTRFNATFKEYVPSSGTYEFLNELADLLCHLQEFITVMGASTYPVISKVYPLVYQLLNGTIEDLDIQYDSLSVLKDRLLTSLECRFDYVEKSDVLLASTYLDYRYKDLHFVAAAEEREEKKERAHAYLKNLYNSQFKERDPLTINVNNGNSHESQKLTKY